MRKACILLIMSLTTLTSYAKTVCNNEDVNQVELLSLKGKELKINRLKEGSKVLFNGNKYEIAEFFVTGDESEGIVLIADDGKKTEIWCTDRNSSSDN